VSQRLLYLDSSAILKVAVPEPESKALFKLLGDWPLRVSSELARTEVSRALRRVGATAPQFRRGQNALDRIGLMPIDTRILHDAALLKPVALRSLDAIHLATALSLGSGMAAIVTYDARLSAAAVAANLAVWSPGLG
jgi:predicted nucleic acid-binding protein